MTETPQDNPRGNNAQGAVTRKAILDAAGRVFAERGFSGAYMRDIAKAADTALGSVVYHFNTKKNLYLQTIRHFILETGRLSDHFRYLESVDCADRQAVADALRDSIRAFLGACHGPFRVEHVTELYTHVLTDGDPEAMMLLLECFAPVQQLLPRFVRQVRPDFSEIDVAFWQQLLWAQLQYTVMGKKMILYDMQVGEEFDLAFLDLMAVRLAGTCCMPLGLPMPNAYPRAQGETPDEL